MAYDVLYNVDPQAAALMQAATGAGLRDIERQRELEDIDRFNAQMAQRDQFEQNRLAYQSYADDQRLGLGYAGLADRRFGHDQEIAGRLALEALDQQGQANYALAQGQAQAAAYDRQAAAQRARDIVKSNIDQAMSEHDAIQKAWLEGEVFTSDEQFQQAKAAWEQKWSPFGYTWGLPDQIAAESQMRNQQQLIQTIASGFVDPETGEKLMTPERIQAYLNFGVEPKDIMQQEIRHLAESRQRKALEIKAQQDQAKAAQEVNKAEQERAMQVEERERKWQEHDEDQIQRRIDSQQKLEFDKAKAIQDGLAKIEQKRLDYALMKATFTQDSESSVTLPPEPDWEAIKRDFVSAIRGAGPTPQDQSPQPQTGIKTIGSKAEFDALAPGEEYINGNTGQRARKP